MKTGGRIAPGFRKRKISQPGFFGRLNQAVDHRADLGAQRGVGKEEVLAAYHKGFDAALGPVVAQLSRPSSRYRRR